MDEKEPVEKETPCRQNLDLKTSHKQWRKPMNSSNETIPMPSKRREKSSGHGLLSIDSGEKSILHDPLALNFIPYVCGLA